MKRIGPAGAAAKVLFSGALPCDRVGAVMAKHGRR